MPFKSRTHAGSSGPSGAVGQRLRRLTEWAVASCVTAAVGCGPEVGLGALQQRLEPVADGPWQSVTCSDLLLVTDPVQPARAFDYLAVYSKGSSDGRVPSLLSDYGNACQGAGDRATCVAALNARVQMAALVEPNTLIPSAFVVTTTGDMVERLDDAAALARVLGPIDTNSEAVLVAQLAGLRLACASFSLGAGDSGTSVQTTLAGYRVRSLWQECGGTNGKQQLEVLRSGTAGAFEMNETMRSQCSIGRRPEGLVLNRARGGREPLCRLLAESVQLEAASVPAFLRLARELRQLGATALARAAQQSARDELRHTRQMQFLAARYHAEPQRPQVQRPACARGAGEIARDNAVEGCVRETFGALLAWQQAASAQDPVVAQVMREIAADETRHAELSWAIAAWLEPQLPARERAAVDAARSGALAQLSAEIAADPLPSDARAQIGWPSTARQQALLQRMASELGLS
jgi:bacterioferritin (cytochrome b1)